MFLITGITGHVGGAAAEQLLQAGKKVRAFVRDEARAAAWKAKGVELVKGEWLDTDALAKALEGVEGAYLMMPPSQTPSRDFREAKAVIASYREALKESPVPKVVALSSIGSEQTSGLGLITATHLLEQGLGEMPFPVAFVRAGSFIENYLFGLQAAKDGTLPVFYTPSSRAVPMIATRDIGAEVAKLMQSEWTGKKIVELGSMLSCDDLARQLGEVIGVDVKAQSMTPDALRQMLLHIGIPAENAWAFEEMVVSVDSGWIHFGVEGTEKVQGATTAKQVFAAAAGK